MKILLNKQTYILFPVLLTDNAYISNNNLFNNGEIVVGGVGDDFELKVYNNPLPEGFSDKIYNFGSLIYNIQILRVEDNPNYVKREEVYPRVTEFTLDSPWRPSVLEISPFI